MPDILFQDTETFSPIPIRDGTYRYAEEVEIMLYVFAFNDDEPQCVDITAGEEVPQRVVDAWADGETVHVWQNCQFDYAVMAEGWGVSIPLELTHDTMIQAMSHSLPGGLNILCDIFNISEDKAKIKEGKQLINLFCKPRPKNHKLRRATSHTHPEDWLRFKEYALSDIFSMREVYYKMPSWNYKIGCPEHKLWCLDQRMNRHGIKVDVDLAKGAIAAVDLAQKDLADRTVQLTFEDVQRATQRDKLLKHILGHYGVWLPDMKKATLELRLNDPNLPMEVKELLGIRLQASTTSTSKYKKLIAAVSRDGRLRGTLQFNGASRTGRWAGRVFQPQNLPRPTHKEHQIEIAIDAIKHGYLDLIEDNIMAMTSSCVRGVIIASEYKRLAVSDLSNIEGRAASWLAEEDWKIAAFADFDAGIGHDLYKLAYAKSFNVFPQDVNDGNQRQIGKVQELMLQYQGGVGAFITGAASYRIDLDEMAEQAWPLIPEDVKGSALGFYNWSKQMKRSTFGLSKKTFMTCDALKRMWRDAHPMISSYWTELENTIRKAIMRRGKVFRARKLKIVCRGAWLKIILPSGRALCYPSPRIENDQITYMGVHQYTRKWCRIKSYGGKFFENICQAVSRDVMGENMLLADEYFDLLLTVHDEIIAEGDDVDGIGELLNELLATNPPWSEGLPLAAGGYEGYRYRKD